MVRNGILGQIGPIKVYAGFPKNKEGEKHLYPADRLSRLLNINSKNKQEIIEYCEQYKLLPVGENGKIKDLFVTFRVEQERIKRVVTGVLAGNITAEILKEIEDEINKVKIRLFFCEADDLQEIVNDELNKAGARDADYSYIETPNRGKFVLVLKEHQNTFTSIWEEVLSLILNKQKLKMCKNCGQFFLPQKRTPYQLFCNNSCRDKYHKRKTYHKKLEKK